MKTIEVKIEITEREFWVLRGIYKRDLVNITLRRRRASEPLIEKGLLYEDDGFLYLSPIARDFIESCPRM